MQYFYLILFVFGALLLLFIMHFIYCNGLSYSVKFSLLVSLFVVVLRYIIIINMILLVSYLMISIFCQ